MVAKEVFTKDGGGKHGRYFVFRIDPNGGPFCYRSRTALNAFNNPIKRRCYDGDTLHYMCGEWEHNISENIWKETCEKNKMKYDWKPLIELNSIWEYFAMIGFDNKKKIYTNKTKKKKKKKDEHAKIRQ